MKVILFMFFPLLSFAQYPSLLILPNQDTAAILTIEQVKKINITFVKLSECDEVKASLRNSVHAYKLLSDAKEGRIENLKYQISLHDSIEVLYMREMQSRDKVHLGCERRVSWLKLQRGILGAGFFAAVVWAVANSYR